MLNPPRPGSQALSPLASLVIDTEILWGFVFSAESSFYLALFMWTITSLTQAVLLFYFLTSEAKFTFPDIPCAACWEISAHSHYLLWGSCMTREVCGFTQLVVLSLFYLLVWIWSLQHLLPPPHLHEWGLFTPPKAALLNMSVVEMVTGLTQSVTESSA